MNIKGYTQIMQIGKLPPKNRRSTSAYCLVVGDNISFWKSKKHIVTINQVQKQIIELWLDQLVKKPRIGDISEDVHLWFASFLLFHETTRNKHKDRLSLH